MILARFRRRRSTKVSSEHDLSGLPGSLIVVTVQKPSLTRQVSGLSRTSSYHVRKEALPESDLPMHRREGSLAVQGGFHKSYYLEDSDDDSSGTGISSLQDYPTCVVKPQRTKEELAKLRAAIKEGGISAARDCGFSVREAARFVMNQDSEREDIV